MELGSVLEMGELRGDSRDGKAVEGRAVMLEVWGGFGGGFWMGVKGWKV